MVIRLLKAEHNDCKEALSISKDTGHHAQEREVYLLHKDRPFDDVLLLHAIQKKPRNLCDLHRTTKLCLQQAPNES